MATLPKFVQAKKMFLLSPVTTTEAVSIILSQFVDIYANQLVPLTDFNGTIFLTINPAGANEEIISFTNGTANADGSFTLNTGIARHLAAKSPYDASGTPQSHSAGEEVVISNEPQFYKAITDYAAALSMAAAVQATKTAIGYVKETESNTNGRVYAALVSEQSSPNMTLAVTAFSISALDQIVDFAGGNTPTMTAPVSNTRIDLVVYDTVNSIIAIRTGTENASPVRPTPTSGDITLAAIFHRVGETSLKEQDDSTNGYIQRWFERALYKTPVASGIISPYAGRTAPTGYLLCDGTAVSRTGSNATLFSIICPSQTATITIASPGVVTATSHGLVIGDRIHFTTTGGLPSGISTNTDYYVISAGLTSNAFEFALSPSGTAVVTSGSQNGVHTVYKSAWGKGDGSTTFNVPDLRGKNLLGMGATNNITLSFETGAVGTNTIAVPDSVFPSQGQPITLSTTGSLPTGLAAATTYYVQRVSSTSIKLASTQALADSAAADLTFTSTGSSGVHTITYALSARAILGRAFGEEMHGQSALEVAGHVHQESANSSSTTSTPVTTGVGSGGNTSAGIGITSSGASISTTVPLNTQPNVGDTQHNNMSPSVQLNYIIKT